MARTEKRFLNTYAIDIHSVIRGHHVYKDIWKPIIGEKLICKPDKREEAKIFDDYAVGICEGKRNELVGHVPIELSFLFFTFIKKVNNEIFAEVKGGRKLENGLVIPVVYHVRGNQKHVKTFLEEIEKLKEGKAMHMNLVASDVRRGIIV